MQKASALLRLARSQRIPGPPTVAWQYGSTRDFNLATWIANKTKGVRTKIQESLHETSQVETQAPETPPESDSLFAQTTAEIERTRELKETDSGSTKRAQDEVKSSRKKKSHEYSTAVIRISHRKLQKLSDQINGKPIDHAILQMQFSEKRVSTRIQHMLLTAKDHAQRYKHLDPSKIIVAEAFVNKAHKASKKVMPAGRGHMGVIVRPQARMKVVLKEGKTLQEKKAADRAYKLKRIVSAHTVREDKPLRLGPSLGW